MKFTTSADFETVSAKIDEFKLQDQFELDVFCSPISDADREHYRGLTTPETEAALRAARTRVALTATHAGDVMYDSLPEDLRGWFDLAILEFPDVVVIEFNRAELALTFIQRVNT